MSSTKHLSMSKTCGVSLGAATQVAPWIASPYLGAAITVVEMALLIMVVLTALFGNTRYSKRAFILMPWVSRDGITHIRLG